MGLAYGRFGVLQRVVVVLGHLRAEGTQLDVDLG